jgi:hypothetical protein
MDLAIVNHRVVVIETRMVEQRRVDICGPESDTYVVILIDGR